MKPKEQELYCHGHRVNYVLDCCFYNTEYCEHSCNYAKNRDPSREEVKGLVKRIIKDIKDNG